METIPFIEYIKELIKQAHRYQNTKIYYNLDKSLPTTLDSVVANTELKDKFDMTSMELQVCCFLFSLVIMTLIY